MANQTGRPIAPARRLVSAVMATLAVFVIVFGLGMASFPVAIFGLAVLALAVGVAFMNVRPRGGRATVAGTAEVNSITPPPAAGAYGRATIELVVVAPGLGAFETMIRESRVPVDKWPLPGTTVPITVDVDDTRRVRVNWRDAPSRPEGGDPPPPPQATGRTEPGDLDDELLGSVDPAPWEGRHDWDLDGEGLSSRGGGTTTTYARRTAAPVVVRDTPAGTIVEGHVVDTEEEPPPLPRRAGNAHRFDPHPPVDDDPHPTPPPPDLDDTRHTAPSSPGVTPPQSSPRTAPPDDLGTTPQARPEPLDDLIATHQA
ncbi:MAG TPA: hypothetical protein VN408_43510, partial [Actinoplanes sp.]|nr:hypothetical protein [Actinoplanes sp.]